MNEIQINKQAFIITSLIFTVLTACHSTTSAPRSIADTLSVQNYRPLSFSWPKNIANKEYVIETLLSQLRLTEHRNIKVNKLHSDSGQYIIEILNNAVLDDSTSSIFYRIQLANKGGYWLIGNAEQAFKCAHSDASTAQYSAKRCL